MPSLYLVAAPIGDTLSDLSIDGLRLMRTVPTIVLEADDGYARRLREKGVLNAKQEVLTMEDAGPTIARALDVLDGGGDVVLTASSGIPCFVDPGSRLVDEVLKSRLDTVSLVPVGASSALDAALMLSGQSLDAFTFGGHYPEHFLPLQQSSSLLRLPTVYYVRGPAIVEFVQAIQGLPAGPPWRMVLLKDIRKKGMQRVEVVHGNAPFTAETEQRHDWVVVVQPAQERPGLQQR